MDRAAHLGSFFKKPNSGRALKADAVVIGKGVKPNIQLAEASGIGWCRPYGKGGRYRCYP